MSTRSRPPAITAEPWGPTPAEAMVESGLLDVAAGISNVARSLADSAITSIKSRMTERGRRGFTDEFEFLREAIFEGIARQLIERVERRLKAERQKSPCRQRDGAIRP
jgi:hypothetical protein